MPNHIEPASNLDHRDMANQLVEMGFEPNMVIRFTEQTCKSILRDAELKELQSCL